MGIILKKIKKFLELSLNILRADLDIRCKLRENRGHFCFIDNWISICDVY